MELLKYALVLAAGLVAGFINTLAGSGSLITLPALIFAGLPANIANATNRVAVFLQCLVGVRGFHKHGLLDWRGGIEIVVPSIVGAIIGALIAVDLNETIMRRAIGVLMIVMLFVLLIHPERWIHGRADKIRRRASWIEMTVFFFVGLYGGFLQAGVGIFILAGLTLIGGYDLVRANALKLLIVAIFTGFALLVFIWNGQVRWGIGLVLAAGNMIGAWIATTTAARKGARFVHGLLVVVVVVSALMLLGGDAWLRGMIGY